MAYCTICGNAEPCQSHKASASKSVPKKKGKPTPRSQAFARARKSQVEVVAPSDKWVVLGPGSISPRKFSGQVTLSGNISAEVKNDGTYFAINLAATVSNYVRGVSIHALIFRIVSIHSDGIIALMNGYDPANPVAPTLLQGKRFAKDSAFGVQIVAPYSMYAEEIPDTLWLVMKFDASYKANTTILARDLYIQHSLVNVVIPSDVLHVDAK